MNWLFEPSLKNYITRDSQGLITPVNRKGLGKVYDYYFISKKDSLPLLRQGNLLFEFKDSGNKIFRNPSVK